MSSFSSNLYKDDMHANNSRKDPEATGNNYLRQEVLYCLMDTAKRQAFQIHRTILFYVENNTNKITIKAIEK